MSSIKRSIAINTLSNYIALAVRIVSSLLVTRLLLTGLGSDQHLSTEEFGFWGVLMSIFGYTLTMDFGFGVAAQKYTASARENNQWKHFSQLISTIFYSYFFLGAVIALAIYFGQDFILRTFFELEEGDPNGIYIAAILIYGLGTAAGFPLAFFAEILRGMERIALLNAIRILNQLMTLGGMLWAMWNGYGLFGLIWVLTASTILSNLLIALTCFRLIPGLRLWPRYFSFKHLREVASFSLYAYVIMCANLLIWKTDVVVISSFLSTAKAAPYILSLKVVELFRMFSLQMQETITPIARRLYVTQETEKLRQVMLETNRITAAVSTLLFVLSALYLEPLLQYWLKPEPKVLQESVILGWVLLFSMYFTLVVRSSSVKIFLMSERHAFLMVLAVVECSANLAFSIIGIHLWGLMGVALGTLIPNLIINGIFFWPKAIRYSELSFMAYLRKTALNSWIAGAACAALLYTYLCYWSPMVEGGFWRFVFQSISAVVLYVVIYVKLDLSKSEIDLVKQQLAKLRRKS